MPTLEEIRERFKADRFATETVGIEIVTAGPDHAVCSLTLDERHYNANHTPQGGAIFTLADFTFAIAANGHAADAVTVSLQHDITYLSASRGTVLTATADCIKKGRTVRMYEVTVTDDLGKKIAYMTVNGFVSKA